MQRVFKKWVLVLAGSLLVSFALGAWKTDLYKAPNDGGVQKIVMVGGPGVFSSISIKSVNTFFDLRHS
jgi:hypothetical protein